MKAFYSIVLIFLIGFFSSTFMFVLSPIDYKDSIVIEEPEEKINISLAIEGEDNLVNPKNIVVKHISDKEMPLASLPKNVFTVNIYNNNELVASDLTNLENTTISFSDEEYIIDNNNPLKTTLDISQEKLNLKDGNYTIVFKSNIIGEEENNSIKVNVSYESNFTYYEAQNSAPSGTMGLKIYFPDKDLKTLIPVTRYVVKTLSLNRQVINELQLGPVDNELTKSVDIVNYCVYKNNYVYIDLPTDNEFYNQNSTIGKLSFDSFINSIFAMNKYLAVDALRFTIDNYPGTEYFSGIDISQHIFKNTNPIIYLGYKTEDRVYLIENEITDIDMNTDIQTITKEIMEYYSSKLPINTKSPLPDDVKLESVLLENKNLILNFNDKFLTAFDDNEDKRKMMIDSLVYTFTSIPNVNTITIRVNDNVVEGFIDGKDITGAMTAPAFINPESVTVDEENTSNE